MDKAWTTLARLLQSDFIDKPWVIDPDKYIAKNYTKPLVVGYSQRLARSATEATIFALSNAGRQGRNAPSQIAPNQIVDRFVQKISFPYGELWQESILVNQSIPPTDDGITVSPASRAFTAAASKNGNHAKRQGREAGETSIHGFTPLHGLILTTIGLIGIGWISNLLTQGYYRQNITHTVITGVAVVLGLLVLTLLAM